MHSERILIVNQNSLSMFPAGKLNVTKWKLFYLVIFQFIYRVNLIGEHIDYCGYPVLPMAVEQSILLAVAPSDDRILHIANTNERYKPTKCSVDAVKYV